MSDSVYVLVVPRGANFYACCVKFLRCPKRGLRNLHVLNGHYGTLGYDFATRLFCDCSNTLYTADDFRDLDFFHEGWLNCSANYDDEELAEYFYYVSLYDRQLAYSCRGYKGICNFYVYYD